MALYQPEEENRRQGRRHKTPPQLLRRLLLVLLRWYPERRFVCTADGNYATHDRAELASQYCRRLTFISKFYPGANLVAPPPNYSGKGRPRVKGKDLSAPAEVVASTLKRQRLEVAWYGGGRRRVEVVTGTGHWYKSGRPLVPVRWAFVRDLTGTHRDEYFFTTESTLSPRMVIEIYTGR